MFGKKALRRHHYRRLKKKRKDHYSDWTKTPRVLGRLANTACVCSCCMCGNARKAFNKLTVQEKRAFQDDGTQRDSERRR